MGRREEYGPSVRKLCGAGGARDRPRILCMRNRRIEGAGRALGASQPAAWGCRPRTTRWEAVGEARTPTPCTVWAPRSHKTHVSRE